MVSGSRALHVVAKITLKLKFVQVLLASKNKYR
jgi:hypothetical protein